MGLNDARPFTRADVPILTFLVVGAVLDSGTELRNCENLGEPRIGNWNQAKVDLRSPAANSWRMRPWRPRRVLDLEPTRRAVRPSRNIQSFCWVIAHYRQRTQSGRPKGRPHPVHPDTGDCFGAGAITHFHLSKDEGSHAHARRDGRANPTRVLEVQAAGQMPILRRGARNLRA